VTVQHRHHHIAENQVGQFGAGDVETHLAVFGGQHLIAFDAQHHGEVVAQRRLVFDEQDFFHDFPYLLSKFAPFSRRREKGRG